MYFLQFMQIDYQILDYKNYLVLRQNKPVQPIEYCCRMLEQNQINGLLPMYSRRLNDKIDFFYDISDKQRLTNYLQHNHCTDEQGRQILLNMANCLKNLSKYFLKQQLCIMDFQCVFINHALQVFFPVLPLVEMLDNHSNIQEFFRRIVSDFFVTEHNNQFYDGLLKYLSRQDFDLNEFVKRLQPEKKENSQPVYPMQSQIAPLPEAAPEPPNNKDARHGWSWPFAGKNNKDDNSGKTDKTDKHTKKKNKKETKKSQPPTGINIPGMSNVAQSAMPVDKNNPEPTPAVEPKKKRLFDLGKKSKAKAEEPAVIPQPIVQPQPVTPQAIIPPTNPEIMLETEFLMDLPKSSVYLYHDHFRVEIRQTPFSLGKIDVDYQINKGFISKRHAIILLEDGDYYIQDENSRNHTYLNGEQLPPYTPYKLINGSKIKLGSEEMTFYDGNDK